MLQTKIQILFSSQTICGSAKKPDEKKKKKRKDEQTFAYFSSAHRRFQEKCQPVKSQLQ